MNKDELISGYNSLSPVDQVDFQKQTGLVSLSVSTKFKRTDIAVGIPAQTGTFNNKNSKDILKLRSNGGLFSFIDENIAGWEFDNNPTYEGCEAASGIIDKLENEMTSRDIITEGKRLGTYKKYNMWQAQLLANEIIRGGGADGIVKSFFIYLTETKNGIPCKLSVYRDDGGSLKVNVRELNPGDRFCYGVGFLSSN